MTWSVSFRDVIVVFGFLIFIFDEKTDRRSGGLTFENTREKFHGIAFFALGDNR